VDASLIGPDGHRAAGVGRTEPNLLGPGKTDDAAGRDERAPFDRCHGTGRGREVQHHRTARAAPNPN
jgi:hypothetical protein